MNYNIINYQQLKYDTIFRQIITKPINKKEEEKRTLEIENKISDYLGLNGDYYDGCFFIKSWIDALNIIFIILKIEKDDEIIIPAWAHYLLPSIIIRFGGKPVLCEIRKDTFHLDPFYLAGKISSKTKAIISSDLFGQISDYSGIKNSIGNKNIVLIQDFRDSFGALQNSQKAGLQGDISFGGWDFPNIGESGLIICQNREWIEKIKNIRNGGVRTIPKYVENVGCISHISLLLAELTWIQIEDNDKEFSRIDKSINLYKNKFEQYERNWYRDGPWKTPCIRSFNNKCIWKYYPVRFKDKSKLAEYLNELDIDFEFINQSRNRDYKALHLQPLMIGLGYRSGDYPISEKIESDILYLPCNPEIEEWKIRTLLTKIYKFYNLE